MYNKNNAIKEPVQRTVRKRTVESPEIIRSWGFVVAESIVYRKRIFMNKIQIIVNNGAGTGSTAPVWKETKEYLQEKAIPYNAYLTRYEKHAMKLAGQICEKFPEDPIYLLVVGGDGTINEVLNGITDFDRVRLGVIPTGSGNDFARNLGISRDTKEDLEEIAACIEQEQNGETLQRIDLGEVSWEGCERPRIFGISAGAGLDAIVCKKALHSNLKKVLNRFHLGKLTYLMLTVQTLFSMKTFEARVTVDGETETCQNMIFGAAMNLRAEGGGVPMAPESTPYDGKISLSSAAGIPKWKTFFLLPLLAMGKQGGIKGFTVKDGAEISMELDRPVVVHADGEYCGDLQHIRFRCRRDTLWLLYSCRKNGQKNFA